MVYKYYMFSNCITYLISEGAEGDFPQTLKPKHFSQWRP